MEERRVNWKQIFITAAVTGIVTLGVGMALYYIQTPEPRLTYSVEDTLPFEGPSENIAIYHVRIENNGKKVVEDVVCQLSFSTAIIKQHRIILEPSIAYTETILNNSYRAELLNLNPQESTLVSVLASSPDKLPPRPEISLRGKGITGIEVSGKTEKNNVWTTMMVAMIAAFAGLSSLFFTRRPEFLNLIGLESPKHSSTHATQRGILSYLCGIHNLNSEVENYLKMPSDVTYWSEADRFAMLAVEDPTGEDAEKRKHVLNDLLKYAEIASLSEGIIHYNIARIAKAQSKEEEADDHLKKAEKIMPELVKTRLEIDPIFGKK